MNHDLKYGLMLGIINVLINASIIMIDYTLLTSAWWVSFINVAITISILLIAGFKLRSERDGVLPFKEAFLSTWLIIVIAGFLSTVYSIVQYNVLTPELPALIQDSIVNETATLLQNFGADDQTIDEAVAELQAENSFSVNNLLESFLYTSILGGAVLAAILGLIVKKNPTPEFR